MKYIFCLFILAQSVCVYGQAQPIFSEKDKTYLEAVEDTLVVLGHAIVNDSAEINRFAACKRFIPKLVDGLKVRNSFQYSFERLTTLSIIAPPDSSFRIFTWQLFVNDSTYKYYGAIQMNTPDLKLYPLIDKSFEMSAPATEVLDGKNWYGALYYDMKTVKTKKETYYLMFGFDAFSFFEKRKLIDVLQFDASGKPSFGKAIFTKKASAFEDGGLQNRLLLEYAASTSIKCNWDDFLELVIFDNLIPIPNPYGPGMTYVTDGSYQGYKITDEGLEYVEKVFTHTYDEAPSPEPINKKEQKRDILGRKEKN